jgi:hypothetical protein
MLAPKIVRSTAKLVSVYRCRSNIANLINVPNMMQETDLPVCSVSNYAPGAISDNFFPKHKFPSIRNGIRSGRQIPRTPTKSNALLPLANIEPSNASSSSPPVPALMKKVENGNRSPSSSVRPLASNCPEISTIFNPYDFKFSIGFQAFSDEDEGQADAFKVGDGRCDSRAVGITIQGSIYTWI